jgi:hypothetical protein
MTVKWYESSTGSYVMRQTNSSASNGTYWWHYTQATLYLHTYYWRVDVLDGTNNASVIYHFETLDDAAPTLSNPYPSNASSGIPKAPWCHIQVSDANLETMTITWSDSSSGVWLDRQTNASVPDGIYWWHYTGATAYSTTYYWRINVTDGVKTSVGIYHFTTLANSLPVVSFPFPTNGSTGQTRQSWCHVYISDANGESMTLTWYENTTGSYILRQTNSSCPDGTYWWHYTQSVSFSTVYYWKVIVNDGIGNTVVIFHFTTGANTAPVISSPTPANGSSNRALNETCGISISDADMMTLYWYENTTGSWVLRQTDGSVTSGTYTWSFTQASAYMTTYYWRVVVSDGVQVSGAVFHYTTGSVLLIYDHDPPSGAGGIMLQPNLAVAFTSSGPVTVRWYENSTGNWTLRATTIGPPGTQVWQDIWAANISMRYFWMVNATNGADSVNATYNFTTGTHIPERLRSDEPMFWIYGIAGMVILSIALWGIKRKR